jgi:hypothetical protein
MKARYINSYTDVGLKKLFGEEGSAEIAELTGLSPKDFETL